MHGIYCLEFKLFGPKVACKEWSDTWNLMR
jgi:hypothetical protein